MRSKKLPTKFEEDHSKEMTLNSCNQPEETKNEGSQSQIHTETVDPSTLGINVKTPSLKTQEQKGNPETIQEIVLPDKLVLNEKIPTENSKNSSSCKEKERVKDRR